MALTKAEIEAALNARWFDRNKWGYRAPDGREFY
jgi:hypothetical protein